MAEPTIAASTRKSEDRFSLIRILLTTVATALGGFFVGVLLAPFAVTGKNTIDYLVPGVWFGLLALAQSVYVVYLFRALNFDRTDAQLNAVSSASRFAFGAGLVVTAAMSLYSGFTWSSSSAFLSLTFWLLPTLSFLFIVSRASGYHWAFRADLQKELSGFLLIASALVFILLMCESVLAFEDLAGVEDSFTSEVTATALIAASVMAIPSGIWIAFLLRQRPAL